MSEPGGSVDLGEVAGLLEALSPVLLSTDDRAGLVSLCEATRTACQGPAASVAVVDDDTAELVYVAAVGPGADALVGTRLPRRRGIAGFVAASGQALYVSDVHQDTRFAVDVARSTGYVPTAMLVVPVEAGDDTLGVLAVLDPDRPDLETATALAAVAASILGPAATGYRLGRAVMTATAAHPEAGDLAEALRTAADTAPDPADDLVALAALFAELGRLDPTERATATRIVAEFTRHAATAHHHPAGRPRPR